MRNVSPLLFACGLLCGWPFLWIVVYHLIRSYGSPVVWSPKWTHWRDNKPIKIQRVEVKQVESPAAKSIVKGTDHVEA